MAASYQNTRGRLTGETGACYGVLSCGEIRAGG